MNYSTIVDNNNVLKEEVDINNLISSISLAVCSILLSIGGLFTVLQKSRCRVIKLCCIKCDREISDREISNV
jgi:hypothetical protein